MKSQKKVHDKKSKMNGKVHISAGNTISRNVVPPQNGKKMKSKKRKMAKKKKRNEFQLSL